MHRAWRTSWLLIAGACSGDASAPPPAPPAAPVDAALAPPRAEPAEETPFATTGRTGQKRSGRPIEIILRSTPSGAKVAVDGIEIGVTPTIWLGETGAPHEFTFVLAGHALARYRFVPVASGLVHPRLEPVADVRNTAMPPPGMMAPQPAPPTVLPPAPPIAPLPAPPAPPTVVEPPVDAAAPVVVPATP